MGEAANPYAVFDLSVGRSRDSPIAFLKGYTGFVHADRFAGSTSGPSCRPKLQEQNSLICSRIGGPGRRSGRVGKGR